MQGKSVSEGKQRFCGSWRGQLAMGLTAFFGLVLLAFAAHLCEM